MADTSDAANVADKALAAMQTLVVLVGLGLAAAAIWAGLTADEPWKHGPLDVTEDWQSILVGAAAAIISLVVAGTIWAVLQLGRAIALHLQRRRWAESPGHPADVPVVEQPITGVVPPPVDSEVYPEQPIAPAPKPTPRSRTRKRDV